MRIGVIGATGMAGSAIYKEAVKRGEDVVALVRDAQKAQDVLGASGEQVQVVDAFALTSADLEGFDAIVDAFATAPDLAEQHIELAKHLVSIAGATKPRLVFILGAGSLLAGEDKHFHVEDIAKVPGSEAWINIPSQQKLELDYLRTVEGVDWVGASPQDAFIPGEATTPKLGGDELMFAADGKSHTTNGTMAIAILDELQNPQHRNTRFTASDA
ncbi:NAD(P)-dependent oxidoreductase [Brevibacterium moorei]|uniref:NAD(P)-dependent oxidoreductase n=1 Tax=Brevibacterium moorei TaxID=2968457 RepID=UPI00211C6A94|nr:NAD(P)H-binding protein [Brevibacterium sp. 68QC2CO]MCQ9386916.1 NAD(P)H-binding protein [Brevibacterium sp. 68QC2CO]